MRKAWWMGLGLFLSACALAYADPVILTVSGKIGRFTDAKRGVYQFRDSDLGKLRQISFRTSTSWTPTVTFSGPLVRDILAKVEAKGGSVRVLAINYYRYDISVAELNSRDVVLARRIDNKPFDVAHYGPLWLMYPLPDIPDADKGPSLDAKLVWQVEALEVM
ncbi:oxidoreductase [Chromobacterium alticapitis]|uniref:Oxidoreductase n=2 Tax=Chromobacterium alticapitis TaxID=2073169 RepID=A0A2S5DJX3_9NEIS|nr:oxidoreductase [Chromobacterium alticapitis]